MANAIYPKMKGSWLAGDANSALTGSGATGLYAALVDTGTYTYSASHQFYSDLSGVVGTPAEIANVTTTNGLIDADDVTFSSVSGSSAEAIVVYRKNAGANTTWRLALYIDSNVTNLPVTPNGTDISIQWSASGIVQI